MSVVVAKNLQQGEAVVPTVAQSNHGHLPIKGADGVLITFAKCCRPIPGDPIIAHVSPGKGLVIHHESCRNIPINTTTSNIQSLNTEEKDGRVYSTFIRLTARDRVHLANIMRKIRVMPDVIKVTRNRN